MLLQCIALVCTLYIIPLGRLHTDSLLDELATEEPNVLSFGIAHDFGVYLYQFAHQEPVVLRAVKSVVMDLLFSLYPFLYFIQYHRKVNFPTFCPFSLNQASAPRYASREDFPSQTGKNDRSFGAAASNAVAL